MAITGKRRECDLLKEQSRGLTQALLGSLEEITSACILVNNNAEVRFCNVSADRLVMDNEDLPGQENRLCFNDNTANTKFLFALGAYGQAIRQGEKRKSESLFVSRQSSALPYHVLLIPLSMHPVEIEGMVKDEPVIMVLIHDADIHAAVPPEQYARQYSLTKAELEITRLMAAGLSPIQITDKLSVSINTTRTHIRGIYKKTGVTTQIALMLKLANVPHWCINSLN